MDPRLRGDLRGVTPKLILPLQNARILLPMDPRFSLQAVQHVPVYFWPWVWWQLLWLRGWCEATGRDVLYEIEPTGRVVTFMISDDERDLRSWMYRARATGWDHYETMYDDRYTFGVPVIPIVVGTELERLGHSICYVARPAMPRLEPSIQDSG